MRKRRSIGLAALAASVAPVAATAATVPARPNIVLILADDLGYGDIGAYGQTKIATPNLDALARAGVRFTDFYAGNPVCAPSRAALLTGRDSGHGQIRGNRPMGGDFSDARERGQLPLKAGTPTLPAMLKAVGYDTVAIGKWGLGGAGTEGAPNAQGFDHFFGYLDQMQAHNYYPTHLWRDGQKVPLDNPYFTPHPKINGTSDDPKDYQVYEGRDYSATHLIDAATDTITREAASGHPFFLYFAPTLPHAAIQVPDALTARYGGHFPETPSNGQGYSPHPTPRAARAAMISELDREVGAIRTTLERSGAARNTLVIFYSDNGPSSEGGADIAFFNASGGLRGQKRDLYEGGIRSPFLAYWPGHTHADITIHTISAAWDIMPTLAAIAGAKAPAPGEGHSFRASLDGTPIAQTEPLYWEYHGEDKSGQAVRDGRWKAIRFQPHGVDRTQPILLFDLTTDPRESMNVAAAHPDVVARLRTILDTRVPSDVPGFNFDPPKGTAG